MHRGYAAVAALFVALIPMLAAAAPLRDGDRVAVTVFNHPELTLNQASIDGDGNVAVPLVGNVKVSGLQPAVAAQRIGERLSVYLRKPSVSLSVLQQNASISVVGGPNSVIAYTPGQTLASVAGSLAATPGLDLSRVTVTRDNALLGTYDTQDLLHRGQPGPELQPGDQVVFAHKALAVNVLGLVKNPGLEYLDRGQTLADAVSQGGGPASDAATGAIDLLRNGQHQRLALASPAAEQLAQDGDTVTVPQALHVSVGGAVAKPGETSLTSGTTLFAAVYAAGGPIQYGDISHTAVVHNGVRAVYDITKLRDGDMTQNPHLSDGDIVDVPLSKHVRLGDFFSGLAALKLFFF